MAKSRLTAPEIHVILKACAEARVRRISMPDLQVEFEPSLGETVNALSPLAAPAPEPALSVPHERQNEDALVRDELKLRQDQIQQMMIEDPPEFERLILSGEFEEEDEGEFEDERETGTAFN